MKDDVLLVIDSSFQYYRYSTYESHLKGDRDARKALGWRASALFKPYLSDTSLILAPISIDATWGNMPCSCKLDTANNILQIIEEIPSFSGGTHTSISLHKDGIITGSFQMTFDIYPFELKGEFEQVALVLHRNPLLSWRAGEGKQVYLDRILEGYFITHITTGWKSTRATIFRCFIEIEGEKWEFHKD